MSIRKEALWLGMVLSLTGCASLPLSRAPQIFEVSNVAVLSLGIDGTVTNFDQSPNDAPPPSGFSFTLFPGTRSETGPLSLLAAGAQESLEAALGAVDGWTVVPYEQISGSTSYQALAPVLRRGLTAGDAPEWGLNAWNREEAGTHAASGAAYVPVSVLGSGSVSTTTTVTFGSTGPKSTTVNEKMVRQNWGNQAAALGVDALVFVELRLGYHGTGTTVPISVSLAVAAVDRQGRIVLDTGSDPLVSDGPAVPLLRNGEVVLGDASGQVATAYRKLINDAANDLAARIVQEMQKDKGR